MKERYSNTLLLTATLVVALLLGELTCRLFLDPSDYLSVTLIEDDILGYRMSNPPRGYDSWGFRNDSNEGNFEIVAIGDSQTFGNNATKSETWPQQLKRLSGKRVYNLSLGGYGPTQYYQLLIEKAFLLKPSTVIAALYLGNDLIDAFNMIYGYEHWASFRSFDVNSDATSALEDLVAGSDGGSMGVFELVRYHLSRKSVLYRLVIHGPLLGALQKRLRMAIEERNQAGYFRFRDESRGIDEGFTPLHRLEMLNLDNTKVAEGLRVTLLLLELMYKECRKEGVDFAVLIIPTKERVFSRHMGSGSDIRHAKAFSDLLRYEREVERRCREFFEASDITYVEALPYLRAAVDREKIYPGNFDGHPNKNGYRVIAESVKDSLDL